MDLASQAAVLRVDQLADRDEYNEFLRFGVESSPTRDADVVDTLLSSGEPIRVALAKRMQNLGILDWDVWARDGIALTDRLESDPARARILDLSGFAHPDERLVVALDLLDHLWANRERREPVMVVIDEAHNVCSANPRTELEQATTARLVQIAAEGRKYGLWLFLCTQRPERMPEAVLSQCDNLVLMRMNSRGDLAQLQQVFGFVPDDMINTSPFFRQGECVMAGSFIPVPSFVQVATRRSREGGSDVAVPM
jgi:DNA helicase HerA-like ATPase